MFDRLHATAAIEGAQWVRVEQRPHTMHELVEARAMAKPNQESVTRAIRGPAVRGRRRHRLDGAEVRAELAALPLRGPQALHMLLDGAAGGSERALQETADAKANIRAAASQSSLG